MTSGFIKVDGKDVKDYPLEELREKIGTVLQKAVLFHGTIRENLKWGNPDATEEDLNRAITVAQAKEFVDNKEGRLDFEIEQGGKKPFRRTAPAFNDRTCSRKETGDTHFRRQCIRT